MQNLPPRHFCNKEPSNFTTEHSLQTEEGAESETREEMYRGPGRLEKKMSAWHCAYNQNKSWLRTS